MHSQLNIYLLILISVAMSAAAQILLKAGMSGEEIGGAISRHQWSDVFRLTVSSPWVVGGLALYFLSAAVWLLVLAKTEVSFAYPFVGLGFVITMLLGWALMGDSINPGRIVGTILIGVGVVMIARGG